MTYIEQPPTLLAPSPYVNEFEVSNLDLEADLGSH